MSVSPCFLEESVSLTLTLATAVPLFTPHWNNASPPLLFPKTILKRQAVKSTLYAMFGEGLNVKLETMPPLGGPVSTRQWRMVFGELFTGGRFKLLNDKLPLTSVMPKRMR